MKTVRVDLRLNQAESEALDELAGLLRRSRVDSVREALWGYLKKVRDFGGGISAQPPHTPLKTERRGSTGGRSTCLPGCRGGHHAPGCYSYSFGLDGLGPGDEPPERVIEPMQDHEPTAEEVREALKRKQPKRMPTEVQATSSSTLEEVRRKLAATGTMRRAEDLEDPLGLGKAGE